MCTGLEIAMIAGSTLSGASAIKQMTDKGGAPQVLQQSPIADQEKLAGEAAAKASARRRSIRASSLLATGGAGDASSPVTGQPQGKPMLGS
jgi:hypothetical protein